MSAPAGIRGMGQKSLRSEAIDLHRKMGYKPERIAEMLGADPVQVQDWIYPRRQHAMKRAAISPASAAQRAKVAGRRSITGREGKCHPAHICPRSLGGCDDPLCTVPLLPDEHRLFDTEGMDILRHLVPGHVAELQHALDHYRGDLVALLERVTGDKWVPVTTGGPE